MSTVITVRTYTQEERTHKLQKVILALGVSYQLLQQVVYTKRFSRILIKLMM